MEIEKLCSSVIDDLSNHGRFRYIPIFGKQMPMVLDDSATLRSVTEDLEVMKFVGRRLRFGSSEMALNVHAVASWLIFRALASDAQTAVIELKEFLDDPVSHVVEILLVAGIKPTHTVKLTEDVFLGPVEDAPSELMRLRREAIPHLKAASLQLDPFFAAGNSDAEPECAIWRFRGIEPKWSSPELNISSASPSNELAELASLLTVVGPTPASSGHQWSEAVPGTPMKDYLGRAWTMNIEDTRVRGNISLTSEQTDSITVLIEQYLNMKEFDRKKLNIPIHRLNQSVRHMDVVERAIDLGVALESLLLSDMDEKTQLNLQFRLRGAWLLGKDGEDRVALSLKFRDIYACRSKAVHAGFVGKHPGDLEKQAKLIEDGLGLCADAIRAIIIRGAFPDWGRLVMGL